jgi:RsiW-degrading membrane proteinase PrsW (M82 family)
MASILVALGFLPILLLLTGLVLMDSFKLVPLRLVARSVLFGCGAAALSYFINSGSLTALGLPHALVTGLTGPLVEEAIKAIPIVYLVSRSRVGFMVDAGIHGFAIGTGFAIAENAYYATALTGVTPWLWALRGLGTAVMHGCATAIVAVLYKQLSDKRSTRGPAGFLPGFALAAALHIGFNALAPGSTLAALVPLLVSPFALFLVFELSERATREWLGRGFDHDVEILELISSGELRSSSTGRYLESLQSHFPGPVVADMLCMLQIHLELAMRAKGMLMARQYGIALPPDRDVDDRFRELRYLERAVGRTGLLAVTPLLRTTSRDLWHIYLLSQRA